MKIYYSNLPFTSLILSSRIAQKSYQNNINKIQDIVCNLNNDDINSLHLTNSAKCQRYRRYLNSINKLKTAFYYVWNFFIQFIKRPIVISLTTTAVTSK